jgi:O-antigen ligase
MQELALFVVAAAVLACIPLLPRTIRAFWVRPAWAIVLTVVLVGIPYRSGAQTQPGTHITLADLGAVVLVGFTGLRLLLDRDDRKRLQSWVVLPLLALTAALLLSTVFAPEHSQIGGAVRYLEIFVIVPFCAYLAVRDTADEELVMRAVLGLGIFEGVIGVYQYLTGTGAGFGSKSVRAIGTFGAYDIIALSKVVGYSLIVAVAWAMSGDQRRRRAGLLWVAFLVVPLAMSLSRGSWLGAIVAIIIMLLAWDLRRGLAILLAGTVVFALAVASQGPNSTERKRLDTLVRAVSGTPDNSVQDRYELWAASIGMWEDHPFTGTGPKTFADYKARYAGLGFSDKSAVSDSSGYRVVQLLTPHSLYMLLLAELGGIGAFAFLLFVFSLSLATLRSVRQGSAIPTQRAFGLFALGTILFFSVTNIYGDLGGPTTVLDAVLVGLVMVDAARIAVPVRQRERELAAAP